MSEPIKLCGNCRHWGKPDEAVFEFRTCVMVVHDANRDAAEYKSQAPFTDAWSELEDIAGIQAYRAAHKAVVADGSGFQASLHTREDFGCVLWEPKS